MKKTTYQGSHTSISMCTRRRDKRKAGHTGDTKKAEVKDED